MMANLTKNQKVAASKVEVGSKYSISDALVLIKECATAKFDESVDVSINLGIDTKKSDQTVRGAVVLPNGTGKVVRVAVFTQGDNVQKATDAGADIVGMDDLMKTMQDGDLNYDVVIASPDAMGVVGRLGQVLGPRGLMPNPKVGTVTPDVATAVKNAKAGQVRYRADKAGIVHAGIGKASFDAKALEENIIALIDAIKKVKPSSAKGVYFKKISVHQRWAQALQLMPQVLIFKYFLKLID
jgi:large subunit ribosomal protein L1